MKERFDVAVVVPLDEEFETALSHFQFVSDLSAPNRVRFEVSVPESNLRILLVKQNLMGKTECALATMEVLSEFNVSMLVCLGIAGGLSSDICIGDVCHSGEIADLLDNTRVTDTASPPTTTKARRGRKQQPSPGHEVAFCPTHYETPLEVSVALDLDRLAPERKDGYAKWVSQRNEFGRDQIPGEFRGKDGRKERMGPPVVRSGLIACAAVSGSTDYNKNIKKLNRKVLAIETESGGLFSVAKQHEIPALTVRGISDYAGFGVDKNEFERETNNKGRLIAASNAASYLARQMSNPRLIQFSIKRGGEGRTSSSIVASPIDQLADTILSQSDEFNIRLKELSPAFSLQNQGYRIPVPRVRLANEKMDPVSGGASDNAVEVREAIKQAQVIVIEVPPQYPDRSLAWIIARDLLTTQIGDKQTLPTVIESRDLHRPRHGITATADPKVIALRDSKETQIVLVIDEFNFQSRTQTQFLLDEIGLLPDAKTVVITRNKSNIVTENVFVRKTGALVARLDDISFIEISHFLQKNFEMPGPEAEVIAVRLHETFTKFKLLAHPSYFAGIPVATLASILRANRRAELIELAVAGYLSYVVAQDTAPLTLSRTTREKFLTLLSFEMKFNQRVISEVELIEMISEFAKRFDFKISPVDFYNSFLDKGILFADDGRIRFTLPFMETYLLAKKLHQEPELALEYFQLGVGTFDIPTFTIYAELGLSEQLTSKLLSRLDESIRVLQEATGNSSIILSNQIQPALLAKQDRMKGIQTRLQKLVSDVANGSDESQEKQRLLDATDIIRRTASRQSQQIVEEKKKEERRTAEAGSIEIWFVIVTLLGAGAERMEAETKRALVARIIKLTALLLEDWTEEVTNADFKKIKNDVLENEELVKSLSKSEDDAALADAKRMLETLVDILEYSILSQPLRALVQGLCEEARDSILAESIVNTSADGVLERLLRSIWLSDLDTPTGAKELNATIKELADASFLRVTVAAHLISRVYWRHWNRENRLKLLKAAQRCLKVSGLTYDKAGIQRMIEREERDASPD